MVGAAALLLAVRPELTPNEIKGVLLGSVDQPAAFKGKVVWNGRLNLARALSRATNASLPGVIIDAFPSGNRTDALAPIHVTFSKAMDRASVEVWYRWTPETSGWVTFDLTTGTSIDSILAVYAGSRIDQLVPIAGNDNFSSAPTSPARST